MPAALAANKLRSLFWGLEVFLLASFLPGFFLAIGGVYSQVDAEEFIYL